MPCGTKRSPPPPPSQPHRRHRRNGDTQPLLGQQESPENEQAILHLLVCSLFYGRVPERLNQKKDYLANSVLAWPEPRGGGLVNPLPAEGAAVTGAAEIAAVATLQVKLEPLAT